MHEAAIRELEERRVKALLRREEKQRLEALAAANYIYLEQFISSDGEDHSIDSIDSLDMNQQNKATVLKKAGSTRRNLPQLNFNEKLLM